MSKIQGSEAEIIRILKEAENGVPVPELCRTYGMGRAIFYKWRSRYGGSDASLISEMKSLAEENRRLKRMYADVQLQNDLLKDVFIKKISRPSLRKECAKMAVETQGVSIKLACKTFMISENCYRYETKNDNENAQIADWLITLTEMYPRWGFGLCYLYLRNTIGNSS